MRLVYRVSFRKTHYQGKLSEAQAREFVEEVRNYIRYRADVDKLRGAEKYVDDVIDLAKELGIWP